MAAPLQRLIEMSTVWSAALALLAGLPMLWALYAAGVQMLDLQAWQDCAADPQSLRAWGLTLWTGLAASILTWLTVASLLGNGFIRQRLGRWVQQLPALLATPHAAMAVGLVLWLSPSGWALRLVSPGITGFTAPPAWLSTQDPWGLGLILGLWVKEVPFLLWIAATQMQREDLRRRWQAECALAQTLGRNPTQAFAQVLWPQLTLRLRWPALAVLAYSLTVVDMALIMGPASPPTLAVLAWQWLGDADIRTQAQGVAAAALLTLSVLVLALLWCWRPLAHFIGVKATGAILGSMRKLPIWPFILLVYLAVWWALVLGSVSGVWPFPKVLPSVWTGQAWLQVGESADTVIVTLTLAAASTSLCLIWGVAWLEFGARTWQRALRPWFLLPLVLPSVLWVVGLYGLALQWRLEGQWSGLLLAHALMVLPYVLLALEPAYLAVDARQAAVAASLGHARWVYLWRVKWPLLKRALCSAWAVGFAVSVAQYLPTLYVGAGRFSTVTTEAVTLASGSQRSLMSAYAALQMILPLIVFALATWWGQPRRFEMMPPMKAAA